MRSPADLPDPATSVDSFAELSALLVDPLADRAAILGAAGLDHERWQTTQEDWAKRFRHDGIVAARFAEVFDRTRGAVAAPAAPLAQPLPDAALPFVATVDVDLSPMRPTVASQHPSSPPNPLADTLEAPTRLPVPVLPFKSA
jgi:hypothetical protein